MNQSLLKELIALANNIKTQERLNEKNISEFLRIMEIIIRDIIGLDESVWIDTEISGQYSNNIFGWEKLESEWHIVIGQRSTYNIPNSNEITVYGDLLQKVSESSTATQKEVFDKSDLLIKKIHQVLMERCRYLKEIEEDIIDKIKKMEELLEGPSQSKNGQYTRAVPPQKMF